MALFLMKSNKNIEDNIVLPYVTFLILMMPLSWLVGVDQFVWYSILPVVVVSLLLSNKKIPPKSIGIVAIFFVGFITCLPELFDLEILSVLAYFRDLMTYLLVFILIFFVGVNETIIKSLSVVISLFCVAALFSFFCGYLFSFSSPVVFLFPKVFQHADLSRALFEKSLLKVDNAYFLGYEFHRIKSAFIYSNMCAIAIEALAPFLFCYAAISKGRYRLFYAGCFFVVMVTFILTSSRSGFASLSFSLLMFFFALVFCIIFNYSKNLFFITILCAAFSIALLLFFFYSELVFFADRTLAARGYGSAIERSSMYIESMAKVLVNPFGHGSTLDVPGISIPLGSHSQYLAVLFKYGVVSFIMWVSLNLLLLFEIYKTIFFRWSVLAKKEKLLISSSAVAFLSIVLHQTTLEIVLDSSVAVIYGSVASYIVALIARINNDSHC